MTAKAAATIRKLSDLSGIGKAMLVDFEQLGVASVAQLARCEAGELYVRMCEISGSRQDPCVYDTYRCATEPARNPDLAPDKRNWWYWSRRRNSGGLSGDALLATGGSRRRSVRKSASSRPR